MADRDVDALRAIATRDKENSIITGGVAYGRYGTTLLGCWLVV